MVNRIDKIFVKIKVKYLKMRKIIIFSDLKLHENVSSVKAVMRERHT